MAYALLTFLAALCGLAPSLGRWPPWGDGLELAAVAATGGVAHPTGYPLYSLLGMLGARLLPHWGEVPSATLALHLISMLGMAAAAAFLCLAVMALARRLMPPACVWPGSAGMAGMAAGLALAWGETAFELATTAEVYAMHLALQNALLWLAIEVAAPVPGSPRGGARWQRMSLAGFLLAGLALTHHRMGFFAAGAFGLAWICGSARCGTATAREWLKRLGVAVALGFLGLTPFLYLPIRAAADPPLNWGAPDSAEQMMWVLRGGEFTTYRLLSLSPGVPFTRETYPPFIQERAEHLRRWTIDQIGSARPEQFRLRGILGGAFVALVVAGTVACALGAPWSALPVGATASGLLLTLALYNIADIEGYFLALHALALLAAGVGAAVLWRLGEVLLVGRAMHWAAFALVLPLPLLWQGERPRPRLLAQADGSELRLLPLGQDRLPVTWAEAALASVEPGAVVLTEGDNDFFALLYAQQVLGLRPDVMVTGTNFLKETWYARYFAAQAGADSPFPPFLPETGGGTPLSPREFFDRIARQAIVPAWKQGRPVYFLTYSPLHLAEYELIGSVEALPPLLRDDDAARLAAVLAPPPVIMRRLSPKIR